MSLWYVSFFTGLVAILGMYYSLQLSNLRIKLIAVITFSLLLLGETIDIIADIALNTLLLFFAEMLEMFITVGFFSLVYYTYLHTLKGEDKKRRIRRKKKSK